MAVRRILLPWDSQPQETVGIDWENPLSHNLLVSLPLSVPNYTSIGRNPITGTPTAAELGITPKGTALKLSATGHIALGTACLLPSASTPFTLALYELPDATSAFSSLVGLSGGTQQWAWIRGTNAGYVCAVGRANYGAVQNFTSVGAQVAGVGHRFLVTSPGGVEGITGYRLWMDGVEQTSASTTYGSIASGTNYIGWDGADTKFNGKLQDFNLWGRILSDAEIAAYFSNPYELFVPRSIWVPVSSGAPASYTLTAAAATYSLTGNATGLRASHKLTAAVATYALTGNAAALRATRRLTAAAASYTLTGNAASLNYSPLGSYSLSANAAAYTLTGNAAGLRATRRLSAATGIYNLTGSAASLLRGYRLAATARTYAWTGNAAGLATDQSATLAAGPAAYVWTANPATLSYSGQLVDPTFTVPSRTRIGTTPANAQAPRLGTTTARNPARRIGAYRP